ncbi:MAG: four helix bundle protein [Bacteroidales bacterium]|nr:four helix bundle protein [Bacteroidales bacterium]
MKINKSEASETVYWLEIITDLNWVDSEKIQLILADVNEVLAIFTSIGKKLKL